MIASLRERWDAFWFEPGHALQLAVVRVLAAGTALWVLVSRDRAGVSGLGGEFWSGVSTITRWRFLLFPGHETLERALTLLAAVLLVATLLGIRPRVTAFASALLLYHLAPLESIVWTPAPYGRGLTLPTLALLLCGIAPSADALAPGARTTAPSWRYGWPVRLLQVWLVSVYFFSGVAKLRASGLAWASGENLTHWLRLATQNELVNVHVAVGGWIADRPLAASGAGALTLAFELGCVVALFSRRARPWFALVAIGFHVGIYLAMNITFNSWPLLLAFVDWPAARDRWRGWRGGAVLA
ncbi:MAG: HTTM domain-containing protein [Gemmatimonadetes bacterium]|nr:HTTM domain-containing protein [Gemmatimonadota bacterium]